MTKSVPLILVAIAGTWSPVVPLLFYRSKKVSFEKSGSNSAKLRKSKSSAILFSKSSTFQLGDKDLKRRTGSWRVLQILFMINLAYWIGFFVLIYPNKVAVLNWLGLSSRDFLSIVFLVQLAFSVIGFAYLNLYHLPKKKSSTQP